MNAPRKRSPKPTLLSGGNPQIAKADGDAPVQEYIQALSGWQQDVAKRLDELICRVAPEAIKAVRWNSPMYGIKGNGWFVSFHIFTRFVKVTFFKGTQLQPAPTGGTNQEARWINIHEGEFNEQQLASWVSQAAALPGWGTS